MPDNELLARLDRRIDGAAAEWRRLADLDPPGLIHLPELDRRSGQVAARLRHLQVIRDCLGAERTAFAQEPAAAPCH